MASLSKIWNWYECGKETYASFIVGLFAIQVVHLIWLTTNVVLPKAINTNPIHLSEFAELLIIVIDYTEIPAILAITFFYISEIRRNKKIRDMIALFLINSQWIHILWITDAFIVGQFASPISSTFPVLLLWLAILIDYAEIPVIIDSVQKLVKWRKEKNTRKICPSPFK